MSRATSQQHKTLLSEAILCYCTTAICLKLLSISCCLICTESLTTDLVHLHMPLAILLQLAKEVFPNHALLARDALKHFLNSCDSVKAF